MANLNEAKPRATSIVLADGVERKILLTLNALADLEDKYGSVDAAFDLLNKGNIKALRFVLWASLQEHHPDLTEQQVGSLVDLKFMTELINTIGAAAQNDLPSEEQMKEMQKDVPKQDPN
jgi:hypothetical protein